MLTSATPIKCSTRVRKIALLLRAIVMLTAMPVASAWAGEHHGHYEHGWHERHWHGGYYGRPHHWPDDAPYFYASPPVFYVPPPVIYPPPPPVVYLPPPPSLNFVFSWHHR